MKIAPIASFVVCAFVLSCAEQAPPAVAPAASPEPKTSAGASAASAAPAQSSKCRRDADCDKKSLYCAESPCACVAFPAGGPAPACRDPKAQVQCFVDPCLRKVAKCDRGACVIDSAPTE
jgi:hypothetical protein